MKLVRLVLLMLMLLVAGLPSSTSARGEAATRTITVKAVVSYNGTACAWNVNGCGGLKYDRATMNSHGQIIYGSVQNTDRVAGKLEIYFYNVPVDEASQGYCSGNISVNANRRETAWGQVTYKPVYGTWRGCVSKSWWQWNQTVEVKVTDTGY